MYYLRVDEQSCEKKKEFHQARDAVGKMIVNRPVKCARSFLYDDLFAREWSDARIDGNENSCCFSAHTSTGIFSCQRPMSVFGFVRSVT